MRAAIEENDSILSAVLTGVWKDDTYSVKDKIMFVYGVQMGSTDTDTIEECNLLRELLWERYYEQE